MIRGNKARRAKQVPRVLLARLVQMAHKDPPERMDNQEQTEHQALPVQPLISKLAQWKRWPLEALQRRPLPERRKIRC